MFYTSLLIGSVMIFLTVAIHAVGATLWLRHVAKWHAHRLFDTGPWTLFQAVTRTAGMLLLLHFIEMITNPLLINLYYVFHRFFVLFMESGILHFVVLFLVWLVFWVGWVDSPV